MLITVASSKPYHHAYVWRGVLLNSIIPNAYIYIYIYISVNVLTHTIPRIL